MKKIIFILLMYFAAIQFAGAQNKKIYVSRQGGTKKLLTLGKMGYDVYYFTNNSCKGDTLICSGSGFEIGRIDKGITRYNKDEAAKYIAYNKAIRTTEKRIRKTKAPSGNFNLIIKGQNLSVNYYNADKKGNADIEIVML